MAKQTGWSPLPHSHDTLVIDVEGARQRVEHFTKQFREAATLGAQRDYEAGMRDLKKLGHENPPEDYKQTAAYYVWEMRVRQEQVAREACALPLLYYAGKPEPTPGEIAAKAEELREDHQQFARGAVLRSYALTPAAINYLLG